MQVLIEDAIKHDPELREIVEWATGQLERITRNSDEPVTAAWKVIGNGNGLRRLGLRLADPLGAVEGQFRPEELKDRERAPSRLGWLYADLLDVRFRAHQRKVREMLAQAEGTERGPPNQYGDHSRAGEDGGDPG